MDNQDPESLVLETSPYGNLDAIVEHDGRAVFFYLNGHPPKARDQPSFGTRACWVRNLVPGPYVVNEDELKQGIPPVLPRTHCKYSDGRPVPDPNSLEIVWLEEGNGAALIETIDGRSQTLAVIPPWSGLEHFHGYADECAAENTTCWPMPTNELLFERIQRARDFWQSCASTERHPFKDLQQRILAAYKSRFGKKSQYFSIDGGQFPPRGLAVFEKSDHLIAATVGMSLCPQPVVELQVENPRQHRRAEIAIELTGNFTEEQKQTLYQQLSGLAGLPWRNWTWLGIGHTCALSALADLIGNEYENAVIERDKPQIDDAGRISLPDFRGDPINLLWLKPVTSIK